MRGQAFDGAERYLIGAEHLEHLLALAKIKKVLSLLALLAFKSTNTDADVIERHNFFFDSGQSTLSSFSCYTSTFCVSICTFALVKQVNCVPSRSSVPLPAPCASVFVLLC